MQFRHVAAWFGSWNWKSASYPTHTRYPTLFGLSIFEWQGTLGGKIHGKSLRSVEVKRLLKTQGVHNSEKFPFFGKCVKSQPFFYLFLANHPGKLIFTYYESPLRKKNVQGGVAHFCWVVEEPQQRSGRGETEAAAWETQGAGLRGAFQSPDSVAWISQK